MSELNKNCEFCGTLFEMRPHAKHQKYCCSDCNTRAFHIRNPEKRKEYRKRDYIKHREKRLKYSKSEMRKKYMMEYHKKHKTLRDDEGEEKHKVRSYTDCHFREKILRLFPNCTVCSSTEKLEIHHKKYDRSMEDCVVLCNSCHCGLHSKYGGV